MKRFAIAAVLVAALGLSASAQPPVYPPTTPPPLKPPLGVAPRVELPPVGAPAPNVFVPPGTPPGPAIPVYRSGGVVVGVYGYYPYDSGDWLLGGTDGLTRQRGAFTMVYSESSGVVGPVSHGHLFHGKVRGGLFHR